eukprot:Clim_evm33s236 gene=Clim_evmTU33s236
MTIQSTLMASPTGQKILMNVLPLVLAIYQTPRARKIGLVASVAAMFGAYAYVKKMGRRCEPRTAHKKGKPSNHKHGEAIGVDSVFLARMKRLLKICVPGIFTAEAGYVASATIFMILRTLCDLWMISINTKIEARIIDRDVEGFRQNLLKFFASMVPIGFVNSFLKYSLNEMSLRFRTNLTNYLMKDYLNGFTYYKVAFLDTRISNADQLLTQDLERYCQSTVDLYSNLSKPILDIIIYARRLTSQIGAQGPAIMTGYLALSGVFLTQMRKPVGKYTVSEQRLEGEYRFINARLITHGEEVAFYNGGDRERITVNASFQRLAGHLRNSMRFRFGVGVIDSVVAKYIATVVGFYAVSRPFLATNKYDDWETSDLAEEYYRSGRMLVNMATAIGRVVLAGRELTRLAGFTARVIEIMDVLEDLDEGKYVRTMLSLEGKNVDGVPLAPGNGKIINQDHIIKFERVPIVTPNGDVLVKELFVTVESGNNVLVSGPNGCGKSSLFRILGGLWPLFGGTLTKPAAAKLFYVPQKPYLTIGTLRDQVIYPDTAEDMKRRGLSDQGLFKFLDESLWKFHEYVLHFDGRGSYEFKAIDGATTEWGS